MQLKVLRKSSGSPWQNVLGQLPILVPVLVPCTDNMARPALKLRLHIAGLESGPLAGSPGDAIPIDHTYHAHRRCSRRLCQRDLAIDRAFDTPMECGHGHEDGCPYHIWLGG